MASFTVALVALDQSPVPGWVIDSLSAHGIRLVADECTTAGEVAKLARDADVVWVFGGSRVVSPSVLRELPRCTALLRTGTGVDNMPVAEATEVGVVVAATPASAAETVANHTIALILAVLRQIASQDRLVHQGIWDRDRAWPRWRLDGQTLGVVGFGSIAQAVVRRLVGFQLTVYGHDPFVDDDVFRRNGVRRAELDELLGCSRIVSLHCPLTPATYHLMGAAEFALMREDAVLVNTARGAIVDEAALVRALLERRLGGAALDVLEHEPASASNPLLGIPNVVITPHVAGYSDSFYEDSWLLSVETLVDLAAGYWPRAAVNRNEVVPRRLLRPNPHRRDDQPARPSVERGRPAAVEPT